MSDPLPLPLRAERALVHPLWLGALALLIANDHFFKGAGLLHDVATGKLSDVAGLIVAPALLAVILRVTTARGLAACHLAVGIGFSLIQISAPFAELMEAAMSAFGWRLWPDLTDLLTLPALVLSFMVFRRSMAKPLVGRRRVREIGQMTAATVGFFACVGTSSVQPAPAVPTEPTPIEAAPVMAAAEPNRDLRSLAGYRWHATNSEGTWQVSYRFHEDGSYTASGRPAWQESGKVAVVDGDPQRLVVRLYERVFDGKADDDAQWELVFAADGASFTLNGDRYTRQDNVASIALEDEPSDSD